MTEPTTTDPLGQSRDIADAVMRLAMCSLLREEEPARVIMTGVVERFGPSGLFILCWGMSGLVLASHGQDPREERTYEFTVLHEISMDGVTSTSPADASDEARGFVAATRFLAAVGSNDQLTADVLFRQYASDEDPALIRNLIYLAGQALDSMFRHALGDKRTDDLLSLSRERMDELFAITPGAWMTFGGSGA